MKCTSGWSGGTQEVIVNRVSICQNGNKLGNWSRRKHNDKMLDIKKDKKEGKFYYVPRGSTKTNNTNESFKVVTFAFSKPSLQFCKSAELTVTLTFRSSNLVAGHFPQYSLIVYWATWIIALWIWIKCDFLFFFRNSISKIWCEVCGGKIHISAFYPLGISECPHKLQGLR